MTHEDYRETMRRQVGAAPRIAFACGRDWMRGPDCWEFGFAWDRNFNAEPGELIYRKWVILRWRFSMHIDRSRTVFGK